MNMRAAIIFVLSPRHRLTTCSTWAKGRDGACFEKGRGGGGVWNIRMALLRACVVGVVGAIYVHTGCVRLAAKSICRCRSSMRGSCLMHSLRLSNRPGDPIVKVLGVPFSTWKACRLSLWVCQSCRALWTG
ncbi:hypothetical protein EJ03DRAFT_42215 [Teratosphaeria nubilosa]|uniref:Uncharacterized protein n=1 Tax=Teratosphaeria nubilosa TaxID=161662 RepID=A0A6G1KUS6_9PEZI|nr:hypothetical protein EJ03DRAFT_42215 [Teratosphaeria nubilosa]